MRVVPRLHAKRTVLWLSLLAILSSLAAGCGDDYNAPAPPATAEQKERTDKMREARQKLLPEGKNTFIEKAPKRP
jgi:hypothetical protein